MMRTWTRFLPAAATHLLAGMRSRSAGLNVMLSLIFLFLLSFSGEAQPRDGTVATGETLTEIWIRAARFGDLETVDALIKDDALDIDTSYSIDSKENALVVAAAAGHEEIVRSLIEAGADADHRSDPKKSTALMRAARQGHAGVVRMLLEDGGADVLLKNRVAITALHLVAMRSHHANTGIIELIVEHSPEACFAKDLKHRTPLQLAMENGNHHGADILRELCTSEV